MFISNLIPTSSLLSLHNSLFVRKQSNSSSPKMTSCSSSPDCCLQLIWERWPASCCWNSESWIHHGCLSFIVHVSSTGKTWGVYFPLNADSTSLFITNTVTVMIRNTIMSHLDYFSKVPSAPSRAFCFPPALILNLYNVLRNLEQSEHLNLWRHLHYFFLKYALPLRFLAVTHTCQLYSLLVLPKMAFSQTPTHSSSLTSFNLCSNTTFPICPAQSPLIKNVALSPSFQNSLPCSTASMTIASTSVNFVFCLLSVSFHQLAASSRAKIFFISQRIPHFRTVPGTQHW